MTVLGKVICTVCKKRQATQRHHKFSQTKWARKLYGDLLDDPRNLMLVCADCHSSHASPDLVHWDEMEFCFMLGVDPRSKLNKGKTAVRQSAKETEESFLVQLIQDRETLVWGFVIWLNTDDKKEAIRALEETGLAKLFTLGGNDESIM